MAKKEIQTNLLGENVKIVNPWPDTALIDKIGTIRSVYLDSDGSPKFTVEVEKQLKELFPHAVEII